MGRFRLSQMALFTTAFVIVASVAWSAQVVSTMARRAVPAVTEAGGYFLAPLGTAPEGPGDLAPPQLYELVRPNGEAITIGRMFTSCSCVRLEAPSRSFAQGEQAVVALHNVVPTPQQGRDYSLYVQITRPLRVTLRADTWMQSSQFVTQPVEPAEVVAAAGTAETVGTAEMVETVAETVAAVAPIEPAASAAAAAPAEPIEVADTAVTEALQAKESVIVGKVIDVTEDEAVTEDTPEEVAAEEIQETAAAPESAAVTEDTPEEVAAVEVQEKTAAAPESEPATEAEPAGEAQSLTEAQRQAVLIPEEEIAEQLDRNTVL